MKKTACQRRRRALIVLTSLTYESTEEAQTCATGLELGVLSMQQECEDQDEDEDQTHQSHDQQKPPLLIEGTF